MVHNLRINQPAKHSAIGGKGTGSALFRLAVAGLNLAQKILRLVIGWLQFQRAAGLILSLLQVVRPQVQFRQQKVCVG